MDNLYTADQKNSFDALFTRPSSLYGDTPFWAWNCKLDKEQLLRQIAVFDAMGMGGFHMHPRTGLATPYLSDEYMSMVKACVAEAKKRGMKAHLYDEDRWPSGFAGGLVTSDPKFRARHLILCCDSPAGEDEHHVRTYLKTLAFRFDAEHRLISSRVLEDRHAKAAKDETLREVWLEVDRNMEWFNFQAYVDTLNPEAIKRFVEITHERYAKAVGKEFGKTVPSIFTDEPQFSTKQLPRFAADSAVVSLPFTDALPERFRAVSGCDFWGALGEIVYERADGKYSYLRYCYHDVVAELFASAFADTVGAWCREHGVALTGHMMEEPTLETQTHSLGEAMRSYRSFGMPGIDMLCDGREYTTAKQAQSASHQFNQGGVLSELDGVTDWDFDFAGHKSHGDWQAALGVTVRVPHLAWVSMGGEAKHDYPASISGQSPWHRQYRLIADHFSRVAVAMTRGKAAVRVGVIHPIESYWLIYGPQDQTGRARSKAEGEFEGMLSTLLFGLIDFDYIAESLLTDLYTPRRGKKFHVGAMAYDVVIVPPTLTLRSTTLTALEKFRKAGGRVLFVGDVPTLCNATPSERGADLAAASEQIPFERNAILNALEPMRFVGVRDRRNGYESSTLLYQLREDGDRKYLFLVDAGDRHGAMFPGRITLNGKYKLVLLNTFDGSRTPIGARYENERTVFDYDFYPAGHLLLELVPGEDSASPAFRQPVAGNNPIEAITCGGFTGTFPIRLDEPNVLLLDQAEYRVERDTEFAPREEVLRAGRKLISRLTGGKSSGHDAQPWSWPEPPKKLGRVEFRYVIESEVPVRGALLALENAKTTKITFDGREVASTPVGYWTDEAIQTVSMPDFSAGAHELRLSYELNEAMMPQWCYLLGDFGVRISGRDAKIIAPVRELAWGDICVQGLPFYGGNITYCCSAESPRKQRLAVRIASMCNDDAGNQISFADGYRQSFAMFGGAMVGLRIDGGAEQPIAFAPFQVDAGELGKGRHEFEFTLYGHRGNCFGAVHLTGNVRWAGPNNWKMDGDFFSYEYRLQPMGIFVSPRLLKN